MKKLSILGIVALLLISFSSLAFAGEQDFTLVNKTGKDIHYVYVAPHTQKDWGSDIMGKDALPNGDSVDIVFSPTEGVAMWDLRIEDTDGNSVEWENFNLKEVSKITLKPNAMSEYE